VGDESSAGSPSRLDSKSEIEVKRWTSKKKEKTVQEGKGVSFRTESILK